MTDQLSISSIFFLARLSNGAVHEILLDKEKGEATVHALWKLCGGNILVSPNPVEGFQNTIKKVIHVPDDQRRDQGSEGDITQAGGVREERDGTQQAEKTGADQDQRDQIDAAETGGGA